MPDYALELPERDLDGDRQFVCDDGDVVVCPSEARIFKSIKAARAAGEAGQMVRKLGRGRGTSRVTQYHVWAIEPLATYYVKRGYD